QRIARVERHVRLKLDGVGQPVIAHRIVGCELGLYRAVVHELEQAFIDIAVEGLRDSLAGTGRVVEILRLVERADADDGARISVLRLRAGSSEHQHQGCGDTRTPASPTLPSRHLTSPLCLNSGTTCPAPDICARM